VVWNAAIPPADAERSRKPSLAGVAFWLLELPP